MGVLRKIPAAIAGGVAAVVLIAGPAAAHECYNASRSAQGNASVAANSAAWEEVSLETILVEFIGVPQPVADCVVASADEFGLPQSFLFGAKQAVGQDGVIAESNKNMDAKGLGADGRGIDHAEQVYGDAVGAAIGACSV